jgi:hypothetical protein
VLISRSGSDAQVFHLANATPPTVQDAAVVAFSLLGMREPEIVPTPATLTALDRVLNQGMEFYVSYLKRPRTFDRSNTDRVCGVALSSSPIDRARLRELLEWFLRERRGRAAGRTAASTRSGTLTSV